MRRYFTYRIILILTLICLGSFSTEAQSASADEQSYKVKAVFLFKFFKYISWPDNAASENIVCVYGRNPFGDTLDYILTNKIKSSKYSVVYINKPSQISQCKIMFVSSSEANNIPEATNNAGVLTVSDIRGFARKGGAIEIANNDNKIELYLNRKTLGKLGLTASSKLMKIVEIVE